MAPPFRVLAIDGGGIRGIIPAAVLVDLERRLAPRPLAGAFDLIVGTSTGGILALGLTVPEGDHPRHPAERLLDLYLSDGETIFPGGRAIPLPRSAWVREGSRYSVEGLEEALDRFLGDTPLTAALTDVVVTSYDLAYGEPVMLSSRPELGDVSDVTMVAAARATSAAPMFFKPQMVRDGDRERMLVDGGLYANSPALLGYLLGRQAAARDDLPLVLVSLGTGARPPRTPLPAAERAQMRDMSALARTLLEAVATGGGPGERLPPAKDLAAVLGDNTNAVFRSLRLLRDGGLLEFRRGRGISVAGTPEPGAVVQRAWELVAFARRHGYRVDELIEIIEDVA